MQVLANPVNIIISVNVMPTFHYKCVLSIIYNPDNISKYIIPRTPSFKFGHLY